MKHEKFKLFSVEDIEEDEEVKVFLNSGITPKSISADYGVLVTGIVIGYTEDKAEYGYMLKFRKLELDLLSSTAQVEESLTKAAQEFSGVVCQDITTAEYGLSIVFLVTTT